MIGLPESSDSFARFHRRWMITSIWKLGSNSPRVQSTDIDTGTIVSPLRYTAMPEMRCTLPYDRRIGSDRGMIVNGSPARTSRTMTCNFATSPGIGMHFAAPAAARSTRAHSESTRLRRLARSVEVSSPPLGRLSRPSTAVHRELLRRSD